MQVLIADFFFVCLSLVALLVAIGVQAATKSTVRGRLAGGMPARACRVQLVTQSA
jgi:hypothetical protein